MTDQICPCCKSKVKTSLYEPILPYMIASYSAHDWLRKQNREKTIVDSGIDIHVAAEVPTDQVWFMGTDCKLVIFNIAKETEADFIHKAEEKRNG